MPSLLASPLWTTAQRREVPHLRGRILKGFRASRIFGNCTFLKRVDPRTMSRPNSLPICQGRTTPTIWSSPRGRTGASKSSIPGRRTPRNMQLVSGATDPAESHRGPVRRYKIAVIEGDGIGREVVAEGLRVLEAAG